MRKRAPTPPQTRPSPSAFIDATTPVTYLLFSYLSPLIAYGRKNQITLEDTPLLRKQDTAEAVADRLQTAWEKNKNAKHGIWWALISVTWTMYTRTLVCSLLESTIKISQAIFIKNVISSLKNIEDVGPNPAVIWGVALSLSTLLHSVAHHQIFFSGIRTGIRGRTALTTLLYRHLLNLPLFSSEVASVGKIANVISNDAQRIEELYLFSVFLVTGPLEVIVATWILWNELQWGALTGMATLLLTIPIQSYFASLYARIRKRTVVARDERLKLATDVIKGIPLIKTYAWEKPLETSIAALRAKETTSLIRAAAITAFNMSFSLFVPMLITIVALSTVMAFGRPLTEEMVFTSLPLFVMVRLTMSVFAAKAFEIAAESAISFQRFKEILLLPVSQQSNLTATLHKASYEIVFDNATFRSVLSMKKEQHTIRAPPAESSQVPPSELCDERYTEITSPPSNAKYVTLSNIHGTIPSQSLTVVCGSVGAGKSLLLTALLGELPLYSGSFSGITNPTIGYAPQSPIILNLSILENVLFGRSYDETRWQLAVAAACLSTDIKAIGRDTKLGENGSMLSGGQRARVALARALYTASDLYLLDDPLSAVDPRVSVNILQALSAGRHTGLIPEHAIVVMVTHRLQDALPFADWIVVMNANTVEAMGTVQTLSTRHGGFVDTINATISKKRVDSHTGGVPQAEAPMPLFKKDLEDDEVAKGNIPSSTYLRYMAAGVHGKRGKLALTGLFFTVIIPPICIAISDVVLTRWASAKSHHTRQEQQYFFAYCLVVGFVIGFTRVWWFLSILIKASGNLFGRMLHSVLRVPISWFEQTSAGPILNRFSKDIGSMDEYLPWCFVDTAGCLFEVLKLIVIVGWTQPLVLIAAIPVSLSFGWLRNYFLPLSRQVKRLDAASRSPVYTHFANTMSALPLLRSHSVVQNWYSEFIKKQDANTRVAFTYIVSQRWLGIRLDFLSFLFSTSTVMGSILIAAYSNDDGTTGAKVGLALVSVIQLIGLLQWTVRQTIEVENNMVSVERVLQYTDLQPEESDCISAERNSEEALIIKWPTCGKVEFRDLSMTYPGSTKKSLDQVSFVIPPRTSVAVIGRTGSGKSSLLSCLFRLYPYDNQSHSLKIDDVAISSLSLSRVRSSLTLLPQYPVLFKGTLRFNLDPGNKYTDAELWNSIRRVGLQSRCAGSLDIEVGEGGDALSSGERQLVCLARALLRDSSVFVLDEPTSSIDVNLDKLLQETLKEVCAKAVVFTVAHRLQTIVDYDLVIVMEAGRMAEMGSISDLMSRENGWLRSIVEETGGEVEELIRQRVKGDSRNAQS